MLTTEICVMLLFAAAAVIAYVVRPAGRGPATQHLLAGILSKEGPEEVSADIDCRDDGSVTLWRNGLAGMTSDDAVSLAVNVRGFDVEIIERTHQSRSTSTLSEAVDSAMFSLDFLARQEHYHITYKIGDTVAAAFTLHVRPGVRRHIILAC